MNNNQTKPQQQIIQAIAQLLNEFNMDFDAFCKALRQDYVLIVNQNYQGAVRTAFKTGIDRRTVAAILNNQTLHYKRSLLLMIIDAIKDKAGHQNRLLSKAGFNSLTSIIDERAYGTTTSRTVLDVLTTMGIIEDHDTKFKFIGYPPLDAPKSAETTTSFATQFDEMVTAFISEMQSIRKISDSNQNTKKVVRESIK